MYSFSEVLPMDSNQHHHDKVRPSLKSVYTAASGGSKELKGTPFLSQQGRTHA